MSFKAELVGGPQDGQRTTLSTDQPEINVIGPPMPAQYYTESGPPGFKAPKDESTYLRTGRVNEDGWRIYAYSELKRA